MSALNAARARTLAINSLAISEFLGSTALESVRLSSRKGLDS